ncbi:hypothetical protein IC229_03935 [Spirosoma sp. BT702]|uniref:Uncharacterized protein n=1 Tax=Spirosoma profusum TaxID=2771354 RepID=A0A926XT76_9BACT|nr:hypothetical protein [Spirosoma profusum]MBD2699773.1 hypothetical protein [Spirosoma profusum]
MQPRIRILYWLIAWLFGSLGARAQQSEIDSLLSQRGPYAIVVTAGTGLSYYSTHLGVPPTLEAARVSRFGFPGTIRVMWYPDHRLRVGLETGWTTLYSYRGFIAGERSQVYVSTTPILLMFAMPLGWLTGTERSFARRMSIMGGTGVYIVRSRLNYGNIVNASTYSTGWMAGASYAQPVGRRFRAAVELKWYDAVASENAAFVAEVHLVWRAFSW